MILAWCLVAVAPLIILIGTIRRWRRTTPRIIAPAWGSYLAIVSIALVGLSELRWFVFGIKVAVSGQLTSLALMQLYWAGFFAAPTALVASLLGKGTRRRPACGLSSLLILLRIFSMWDL